MSICLLKTSFHFLNMKTIRLYQPSERLACPGEKGVIAFRSADDAIICGDFQDVLAYVRDHVDLLTKDPLLKMQLNRIESAELQPSTRIGEKFAARSLATQIRANSGSILELQLFQKQKRIWREIDSLDADHAKGSDQEALASLRQRSTEYLIRWLSLRANYVSRNWTKLWHYVHERVPFDDRVTQIAVSWMYALDDASDLSETKSIIYALLQGWTSLGIDYPDYGEFLSDRLATDPSFLFSLLRPKSSSRCYSTISPSEGIEPCFEFACFCVSDLPREQYVIDTVQSSLEAIINFDQAAHAPRDFEQRHVQRAYRIADELRGAI